MISFSSQQPAKSASEAELLERIAELEESNQDWEDEVEALTEEIDVLQESWKRAVSSNEELTLRLQAFISLA